MNKNVFCRFALLTVVTLGAAQAQQSAAPLCETGALVGRFSFRVEGALSLPNAPAPLTFAAVGIQKFDGNGHFTTTNTISIGGQVQRAVSFSGSYSVNPDCTGTMTTRFPDGTVSAMDFVIASGTEVFSIFTDPGSNVTGYFKRIG